MSAPTPTYTVEITEYQARSLRAIASLGLEEIYDGLLHDKGNDNLTSEELRALSSLAIHAQAAIFKVELSLDPDAPVTPLANGVLEHSNTDNTDVNAFFATFTDQENNQ